MCSWLLGDVSRIRSPPSLSPTMHQLMLNPKGFFKGPSKTKIINRPKKTSFKKNFRGHRECAQCQCGGDLSNQVGEPVRPPAVPARGFLAGEPGHLEKGGFVPMKIERQKKGVLN